MHRRRSKIACSVSGRYQKDKFGYRERTAPSKLVVKLPLLEERLDELVKSIFILITQIYWNSVWTIFISLNKLCNCKKLLKSKS